MVRGVNQMQNMGNLPKYMLNATKKATANKKLDLPAKVVLGTLGITGAIKEPGLYDVFEMRCSDYEEVPSSECGWIYDEAHRV